MTLHELDSPEALRSFQSSNPNTLICFSATWCGPCRMAKPTLMDLAQSYARDPTISLAVGIIYEHILGDAVQHQFQIRAFPTYILFHGTREAGRVEGVNFDGIRTMIQSAGCKRNLGVGHTLATSTGESLTADEARAKRVAMLQKVTTVENNVPSPALEEVQPMTVDPPITSSSSSSPPPPSSSSSSSSSSSPPWTDPTASLNTQDLMELTESMGFSLIRAQKGLLYGGGGVDGAVEWIMMHQDDDDIDIPIPLVQEQTNTNSVVAQSYKCNECGKILSNMANLELHANKTGHSDFEESTEAVKPLSVEEKAAKVLEIKALLKARREEREHQEKGDEVEREKQRRFMGKEMSKTREQMDAEARKRDAYMRKKEKEDYKAERERIRRELEQDKLERAAHKGKLASKLGIEGYRPDAIQHDIQAASSIEEDKKHMEQQQQQQPRASAAKIDEYISKIASYKAGGDGVGCLKVLLAYIKHIADSPMEEKYRKIRTDNKIYTTRVKPFVGAKSLILAVGFHVDGEFLVLSDPVDMDLFQSTVKKLQDAIAANAL